MLDTTYQPDLIVAQPASRCSALRSELEATRAAFHGLLEAVSASEWKQKSPASDWSVGEVCVHLTWALEYLPQEVAGARQGKGMFNLPRRLSDLMSYWYIRWIARTATPAALARRYDQAMDAAIRLLDTIPAQDWGRGANFYGEGFHSVEDLFHAPAAHFVEHTAGLWPRP